MTLEDYQSRIVKLFDHGDMSFHLAKLLEEAGELAGAVNKQASVSEIGDEVADVILSVLTIVGALRLETEYYLQYKLNRLEADPRYQDFIPPSKLDK